MTIVIIFNINGKNNLTKRQRPVRLDLKTRTTICYVSGTAEHRHKLTEIRAGLIERQTDFIPQALKDAK